ncbi:MAG: RecX family transcriptional regulator [Actinomycetota bacterium]|nr:RecX family transcriptional regulator [Actinomycetota bacterium]
MTAGQSAQTSSEKRLQKALALSFAQLNRRERTVGEVRRQLERKGIGADALEAAIETLVVGGYLDDGRYALMFVHDKRALEGWGSERIRRELAARGVDRDLVEGALAEDELEHRAGESELQRAVAVLRRRFPSPPTERRERDRALGVLVRKGFEAELAVEAIARHARGD